jgi:hypothetical protein
MSCSIFSWIGIYDPGMPVAMPPTEAPDSSARRDNWCDVPYGDLVTTWAGLFNRSNERRLSEWGCSFAIRRACP